MKNLLIAFVLLAAMAHISFAKDDFDIPEETSSEDSEHFDNQAWENQTIPQYNQTNSLPKETAAPSKSRNKWDFSETTDDTKKESKKSKKNKYSYDDKEYRRPTSNPGKRWEPKKSLTTNKITTSEIAN